MVSTRVGDFGGPSRPALDAATVIVLRDSDDGPEVLVQERHVETDFVGGALVFPGGRVEDADRDLDATLTSGGDVAATGRDLGADERSARGLLVGAAREAFEEAGILFALRDGGPLPAAVLDDEGVVAARAALAARDDKGDFAGLLRRLGATLDLDAFSPFAWWVTPDGMHRRYDTRFFLARVPEGQRDRAAADLVETTSARWMRPSAALDQGAAGRLTIVFPTRRVLGRLATASSVEQIIADARDEAVRRLQPTVQIVDGRPMVRLPGEDPELP